MAKLQYELPQIITIKLEIRPINDILHYFAMSPDIKGFTICERHFDKIIPQISTLIESMFMACGQDVLVVPWDIDINESLFAIIPSDIVTDRIAKRNAK